MFRSSGHCFRMTELYELLTRHHGVLTTAQLRAAGITPRQIRTWVGDGVLLHAHRGKYLALDRFDAISPARALSGRLTCLSALELYGLWVPSSPRIAHVRLSRGVRDSVQRIARLRNFLSAACIHVSERLPELPHPEALRSFEHVDSLPLALLAAQQCCSRNELVAIGDSALRHGVGVHALEQIARFGTSKLKDAFSLLDPNSDSGIESIMRMHLRPLQVRVRSQVWILEWPVDLLVGDWLVIELDGYKYHSSPQHARRDKEKDRALQAAGFTVLRYSHDCVMKRWESNEPQLLQFIREGRHLRPTARSQRRR